MKTLLYNRDLQSKRQTLGKVLVMFMADKMQIYSVFRFCTAASTWSENNPFKCCWNIQEDLLASLTGKSRDGLVRSSLHKEAMLVACSLTPPTYQLNSPLGKSATLQSSSKKAFGRILAQLGFQTRQGSCATFLAGRGVCQYHTKYLECIFHSDSVIRRKEKKCKGSNPEDFH